MENFDLISGIVIILLLGLVFVLLCVISNMRDKNKSEKSSEDPEKSSEGLGVLTYDEKQKENKELFSMLDLLWHRTGYMNDPITVSVNDRTFQVSVKSNRDIAKYSGGNYILGLTMFVNNEDTISMYKTQCYYKPYHSETMYTEFYHGYDPENILEILRLASEQVRNEPKTKKLF